MAGSHSTFNFNSFNFNSFNFDPFGLNPIVQQNPNFPLMQMLQNLQNIQLLGTMFPYGAPMLPYLPQSAMPTIVAPMQQASTLLGPMSMLSSPTISSTTSTTVQPSPVTSVAHSQSSTSGRKDSSNESKEYKNIVSTNNKITEKAYTVLRLKGQDILIDKTKVGKSKNGLKVKAMLPNKKFKFNLYELASNHDLPYPILPITTFLSRYIVIPSEKKKEPGKMGRIIDWIVELYRAMLTNDGMMPDAPAWKVKLAGGIGQGQEKTGLLFNQRMLDAILLKTFFKKESFRRKDIPVIKQALDEMLKEYQVLYPNSNAQTVPIPQENVVPAIAPVAIRPMFSPTNIAEMKRELEEFLHNEKKYRPTNSPAEIKSTNSSSSNINSSNSQSSQEANSSRSSLTSPSNVAEAATALLSMSSFAPTSRKRTYSVISTRSQDLNQTDSTIGNLKNRRTKA